ncbi:MAG: LacI family transcriptional regulator [Actinomycetota bacterium]|nr:LacI family transcriptional regulator [Actinomycetota bacterium]
MDTTAGKTATGRVTIRDVADRAGVSVATVSKVINDRYGVSSATFVKVQAVIDELGYESSLVARSLRNHRTNVVGVLVSDIEPFSAELIKGAARALRGTGYELIVYSAGGKSSDHVGWEGRALTRLGGTLIDGALLVTPTVVGRSFGAPVVAVDPHTGSDDVPTVDSDNRHGAQLATQYLLDLGHRRIGFVGGRAHLESARLRELGFRQTMGSAGAAVDPALVRNAEYEPDVARMAARELLDLDERPSAIFAANDLSAIAVMEEATARGLRVPEDLSVIGFDNIPESAMTTPALTTVHQPIQEMGERAVQILVQLLAGKAPDAMHESLPTRLVVRGSCARPA